MKFEIKGSVMQTVNFELKKGESLFSESGAMAWMSENMKMETFAKGGFGKAIARKFGGESFFMSKFICAGGTGIISFANEFPGKIVPVKIEKGKSYIAQKDAFLCAEDTVDLSVHLKKRIGAGLFGGEGFVLQKISGKGNAFLSISGEVISIDLKKDQIMRIDTGHIAMYEPTVDYSIARVKGIKNIIFGREGLFLATLKGPGKVWLQSMPLGSLAGRLAPYLAAMFRR